MFSLQAPPLPGPAKSGYKRSTRCGGSRIEGTRPVRSRLPPPPSSPANLDREETRAGFPYSFRRFCRSRRTARRAGRAHRATLSVPVSSLDFRGSVCADGFLVGVPFNATVDKGIFGSDLDRTADGLHLIHRLRALASCTGRGTVWRPFALRCTCGTSRPVPRC